jgi:DNA-binding CsgD family transcriptional regulator
MMMAKDLLREIVGQVDRPSALKKIQIDDETTKEVIFELDIDGTRYYIVRCSSEIDDRPHLSPRERAIAELVARGLPNKCIAKQLEISPWTVSTYLRRIFAKLDVSSRAAMIARLLQQNIL